MKSKVKTNVNTNLSHRGGKRNVSMAAVYLALMMASNFFITPAKAQILSGTVSAISAGGFHSLALEGDGTVWAWGNNEWGQLGDGTTTDSPIAVQVSGLTDITTISAGCKHSMALKSDGTVWAWGDNEYGKLGDGSEDESHVPVQVSGLTGVTAISAGLIHSIALKSDGTVWAWGCAGQLGDGTGLDSRTPVRVLGLTGVSAISASWMHSLALMSNGTVCAWGDNEWGQCGDGTTTGHLSPVQVSGLNDVITISAGYGHSLALKNDHTVWAWGWNALGQLGDGTTADHLAPVQLSGLTYVTAVSAGYYHSMALKSDGTVWAWGNNEWGQLGDGTTAERLAPVQVTDLTGITAISAGHMHSLALGSVWAWGANESGQLGDGTTTEIPVTTPVKVYVFDLVVESGFKSGDSPSYASNLFLSDIMCVMKKATDGYKLVGTSPGTFDYAISIENTGTSTFSSISIDVYGNIDFNLHSSNPIRVLDANGADITSQFMTSGTWPTITISSNEIFQGLLGSSSLYITVHLEYALKGEDGFPELYSKAYTLQTTVSVMGGSNYMSIDAYGSVAFLSKKATIIYGFAKTSSGMQITGATITLYKDGTLLYIDTTDADGFYCFIDGVDLVDLTGGTTYTVKCTPPESTSTISQPVTTQESEAVLANFQV